jgi:hypothetical protein
LKLGKYNNINSFLEVAIKDLWYRQDLNLKYKEELEYLIPDKRWLFVNYWTEWKSTLFYKSENDINFKDNR